MKIVFYFLALMVFVSGCNKDVEGFADIPPFGSPENPTSNSPDQPNIPGNAQYQIPEIKSHNNFTNIIYIDPSYTGGGSDGSMAKPITNFNTRYVNGIPPNTAFLFKRGTTHPKIGRLGPERNNEELYKMVWNNNLIGAYGEGNMPIIGGLHIIGHVSGKSPAGTRSRNLTIRDIHIHAISQTPFSWDNLINLHNRPENITIAFNKLEGKHNPANRWPSNGILGNGPFPYPMVGIRGTSSSGFLIIYNNEIFNIGVDGIYIFGSVNGLQIIRNYVHNINRMNWGQGWSPKTDTGKWGAGDGIKLQASHTSSIPGAYIAGNYIDPGRDYRSEFPNGNDWWKFSMIGFLDNGSFDAWMAKSAKGPTVEYNTFIGSPPGTASGHLYWNGPPSSTLRYNVLDRTQRGNYRGGAILTSYHSRIKDHLQQSNPVRIHDNHIIAGTGPVTYPNFDQYIHASNKIFQNLPAYLNFLQTNNPVGSDINPDNFW
jgi:hypothetical protein